MSTWQKDFADLVLAVSAVSTRATDQVWWNQAEPGNPGSHVVLQLVGGVRATEHHGQLTLGDARIRANCYAETLADAVAMRDGINAALAGSAFTASLGNAPASGNEFPSVLHAGDIDFFEPEVDLHRATTDLRITYRLAA